MTYHPSGCIWATRRRRSRPPLVVALRRTREHQEKATVQEEEEAATVKPLLLGYQSRRASTTPAQLAAGERAIAAFADTEGYALAHTFTETDRLSPVSALTALINEARRLEAAAIVVPTPEDLGRTPRVQAVIQQQIQTRTNATVLILRTRPERRGR